ncbi:MAG: 3',5'-cyclic adenosine monophosphate phosphodiesterase CpdA [Paracidovorax wautersii]|uniref:3',5'-cyclic adenosine monophosphate phosphodiesterase CpdA n=1 Tax=Paracidovorax wautersii TaxID=1177982 RepID=A0A7V8JQD6_9BURK|nr:MAG: 3',5'-cyclic adenosine monophosphate phosphodiesterase CpdA [Paracidovorax wautersii]
MNASSVPASSPLPTTLLLQITDPHIREPGRLAYGRIDTAPYLAQAVASITRLPQAPDAIVITGDLVDFGRAAEYTHLRQLLAPLASHRIYLMPGNHDDRDELRRSFPEHSYLGTAGFIQYSVPVGGLQLIALDTVVPRASEGRLCAERLAWLQAQLDAHRERPVVIAMHHPPFATLIGHMDAIGLLEGAAELELLVARHPNVERVICGHLHRSIQVRFGGAIAATAPSVAHQVCLDLSPTAASAWTLEPPGYALHALPAGGRLVSHLAASGDYEGPYPFHADGRLID